MSITKYIQGVKNVIQTLAQEKDKEKNKLFSLYKNSNIINFDRSSDYPKDKLIDNIQLINEEGEGLEDKLLIHFEAEAFPSKEIKLPVGIETVLDVNTDSSLGIKLKYNNNNTVDFISQYPEEVSNPDDIIFDIDGSVKFYNEKGIYTQLYPNVNIELASTNYGKNGTRSAGMRLIEEPFIYSDDNKGGPLKTLTITNNEFNEMLKYCCCNFVSNSDGKLINNFSSVWGGSTVTALNNTSSDLNTYKYNNYKLNKNSSTEIPERITEIQIPQYYGGLQVSSVGSCIFNFDNHNGIENFIIPDEIYFCQASLNNLKTKNLIIKSSTNIDLKESPYTQCISDTAAVFNGSTMETVQLENSDITIYPGQMFANCSELNTFPFEQTIFSKDVAPSLIDFETPSRSYVAYLYAYCWDDGATWSGWGDTYFTISSSYPFAIYKSGTYYYIKTYSSKYSYSVNVIQRRNNEIYTRTLSSSTSYKLFQTGGASYWGNIKIFNSSSEASTFVSNNRRMTAETFNSLTPMTTGVIISSSFNNTGFTELSLDIGEEFHNTTFQSCQKLKNVNLPNVTYLKATFYNCQNLESIDAPNVIKLITRDEGVLGDNIGTFKNCYSLKEINLPNVTECGNSTFYFCKSLEKLELPKLQNKIGKYLCAYCFSLKEISCESEIPTGDAGTSLFNCYNLETINLPNVKKLTMDNSGYYTFLQGYYDSSKPDVNTHLGLNGEQIPNNFFDRLKYVNLNSLEMIWNNNASSSMGDRDGEEYWQFGICPNLEEFYADSLTTCGSSMYACFSPHSYNNPYFKFGTDSAKPVFSSSKKLFFYGDYNTGWSGVNGTIENNTEFNEPCYYTGYFFPNLKKFSIKKGDRSLFISLLHSPNLEYLDISSIYLGSNASISTSLIPEINSETYSKYNFDNSTVSCSSAIMEYSSQNLSYLSFAGVCGSVVFYESKLTELTIQTLKFSSLADMRIIFDSSTLQTCTILNNVIWNELTYTMGNDIEYTFREDVLNQVPLHLGFSNNALNLIVNVEYNQPNPLCAQYYYVDFVDSTSIQEQILKNINKEELSIYKLYLNDCTLQNTLTDIDLLSENGDIHIIEYGTSKITNVLLNQSLRNFSYICNYYSNIINENPSYFNFEIANVKHFYLSVEQQLASIKSDNYYSNSTLLNTVQLGDNLETLYIDMGDDKPAKSGEWLDPITITANNLTITQYNCCKPLYLQSNNMVIINNNCQKPSYIKYCRYDIDDYYYEEDRYGNTVKYYRGTGYYIYLHKYLYIPAEKEEEYLTQYYFTNLKAKSFSGSWSTSTRTFYVDRDTEQIYDDKNAHGYGIIGVTEAFKVPSGWVRYT